MPVSNLDKILDFLKTASVPQGLILATFGIGTFVILAQGYEVPQWIQTLDATIVVFYFSGRQQIDAAKAAVAAMQGRGTNGPN